MRRKPNLEARTERCEYLLVREPGILRGRWLSEITGYNGLHVELGCGKGKFTAESAMMHPENLFVALEKISNVLVIALERTDAENLKNVRYINALADYLPDYFAPYEISRLYINFCDPWPAKRHEKRRLTCRRFLEIYKQVLHPEGEIHFKTDNLELFEFSLQEVEQSGYTILQIDRDLHVNGPVGVMTDYETKFHSLGMPIYQCIMRN